MGQADKLQVLVLAVFLGKSTEDVEYRLEMLKVKTQCDDEWGTRPVLCA